VTKEEEVSNITGRWMPSFPPPKKWIEYYSKGFVDTYQISKQEAAENLLLEIIWRQFDIIKKHCI
jgi:hypothetical protein